VSTYYLEEAHVFLQDGTDGTEEAKLL